VSIKDDGLFFERIGLQHSTPGDRQSQSSGAAQEERLRDVEASSTAIRSRRAFRWSWLGVSLAGLEMVKIEVLAEAIQSELLA